MKEFERAVEETKNFEEWLKTTYVHEVILGAAFLANETTYGKQLHLMNQNISIKN